MAWLIPIALVLHSRRKISPFLFGEYMVANGLGRVVIENLRVNPVVALGMTEPQWIGMMLVVIGAVLFQVFRLREETEDRSR